VTIDETGHHQALLQVDDPGVGADQGAGAAVAADVSNAPVAHRERFLDALLRIDRVEVTVEVDRVGGRDRSSWRSCAGIRRGGAGRQRHAAR